MATERTTKEHDGAARARAVDPEPFANHGGSEPRGLQHVAGSSIDRGRYGRMFRTLRALRSTDVTLKALSDSMAPGPPVGSKPGAAAPGIEPGENPDLPAGYTYLGQFVDHDLTFDPVSVLDRRNDPDALRSFRTPRFDLDSLYGSGPDDSPFLYDQDDPVKLLVGHNTDKAQEPEDLPRNAQGRALIGDPRNDVHVIISQLTLAFIRFHNAVVDDLRSRFFPDEDLFAEAQRLVRWHYQWVVVEEYLRRLAGPEMVDRVLVTDPDTGGRHAHLRFFKWKREPFLPVEFTVAAYRFGHSQVRSTYQLNATGEILHILLPQFDPNPFQHLGGFRPLPKKWKIDWTMFFTVDGSTPQLSRRIDTNLAGPLCELPPTMDKQRRSIALLDLLRGRALGLPSGQAVSAAMGTSVPDKELGLKGATPLWYWLLREAEVVANGQRLGPTCGRIVAEVLVGLLAADPSSYLRANPGWKPELPGATPGQFTIVDLLRFAGVA
jgi:hypothetical protein